MTVIVSTSHKEKTKPKGSNLWSLIGFLSFHLSFSQKQKNMFKTDQKWYIRILILKITQILSIYHISNFHLKTMNISFPIIFVKCIVLYCFLSSLFRMNRLVVWIIIQLSTLSFDVRQKMIISRWCECFQNHFKQILNSEWPPVKKLSHC
jgi:hypothetical protein